MIKWCKRYLKDLSIALNTIHYIIISAFYALLKSTFSIFYKYKTESIEKKNPIDFNDSFTGIRSFFLPIFPIAKNFPNMFRTIKSFYK